MARAISKILFILGSYNVLAYLECIRSYAWSKGCSDPDLNSVLTLNVLSIGTVKLSMLIRYLRYRDLLQFHQLADLLELCNLQYILLPESFHSMTYIPIEHLQMMYHKMQENKRPIQERYFRIYLSN